MYAELNTILRKAVNGLNLDYKGTELNKYWSLDEYDEDGAYCRVDKELSAPIANTVGSNPSQELSGFLQLIINLPKTDIALDAYLSELTAQVWRQFPISDYDDGNFKISYNSVESTPHVTVGGYASVTVRVNFDAYYC